MTMTYFGRIGVSLMLRYHKTHQWAKVNEHACYFTQLLGCLSRSAPHPDLHHFLSKMHVFVKRNRKCDQILCRCYHKQPQTW